MLLSDYSMSAAVRLFLPGHTLSGYREGWLRPFRGFVVKATLLGLLQAPSPCRGQTDSMEVVLCVCVNTKRQDVGAHQSSASRCLRCASGCLSCARGRLGGIGGRLSQHLRATGQHQRVIGQILRATGLRCWAPGQLGWWMPQGWGWQMSLQQLLPGCGMHLHGGELETWTIACV